MRLDKDTVIFELVGTNESSYEDKGGRKRKTTASFGLPAHTTILYYPQTEEEKLEHGEEPFEREIRYIPTHRSIFVDEQNQTLSEQQLSRVWRLASKPQFTENLLMVKSQNRNLLNYLRMHPCKEGNEHMRVTPKQKTIFRERNPVEIARKQNESTKKQIKAETVVFTANFTTKIVPVAQYLGIDVDRDADLVLWDVKQYAINNGERFLELIDSPIVERFGVFKQAMEMGIIRTNGQRIVWNDGRQIVEVPTNYSPIEYITEVSFDDNYRTVYREVTRLMDRGNTPETDAHTVAMSESTDNKSLDQLSAKDLYLTLKEYGEITWEAPYFMFNGERIGKSANEAIDYVEKNKKTLSARLV